MSKKLSTWFMNDPFHRVWLLKKVHIYFSNYQEKCNTFRLASHITCFCWRRPSKTFNGLARTFTSFALFTFNCIIYFSQLFLLFYFQHYINTYSRVPNSEEFLIRVSSDEYSWKTYLSCKNCFAIIFFNMTTYELLWST